MSRNLKIGRVIVILALVLTALAGARLIADFLQNPHDPLTSNSAREAGDHH